MNLSTQICDKCGRVNRPQAKFCLYCRASLQGVSNIPSELLQQRYRVLEKLGEGGFGSVYKAEDKRLGGKYCAIKKMLKTGLNTQQLQEAIRDFEREALLLSSLKHENLPSIYDHFEENECWYLVMDYIKGDTLTTRLEKAPNKIFLATNIVAIGLQLCNVLDYLHTHQPPIIFRDLKPDNIMFTQGEKLYLIDFGIARLFKSGKTKDTVALGTEGYAAPEQSGKAQTTPASDIYSLGVILHQMFSGNDPSDQPFHFAPLNLDARWTELEQVIVRMLDMNPLKRPDLAEVRAVLQRMSMPQQSSSKPIYTNVGAKLNTFGGIGTRVFTYMGHRGPINAVSWSPDGRYIASGSTDTTVRVWEATTGREAIVYEKHKTALITDVAWSPNGRYIASADDKDDKDGTVRVWNAFTGKKICKYEEHEDVVRAIAWSPDGTYIASASDDETVKIWEISTGITLNSYDKHYDIVSAVAWSPDNEYIASADEDETIQIWEAITGNNLFSYDKHDYDINALAWSPNGKYIASASDDQTVRVHYADTGEKAHKYKNKHTGSVRAIAWSPDSAYIASASDDQTVRIWEATTGWDVFTYPDHEDAVRSVAWSPDGKLIASGSSDGTVHVWRAS